jgi:hypothetical protein
MYKSLEDATKGCDNYIKTPHIITAAQKGGEIIFHVIRANKTPGFSRLDDENYLVLPHAYVEQLNELKVSDILYTAKVETLPGDTI